MTKGDYCIGEMDTKVVTKSYPSKIKFHIIFGDKNSVLISIIIVKICKVIVALAKISAISCDYFTCHEQCFITIS